MASSTASGLLATLPNYQGLFIGTTQKKTPLASLMGLNSMNDGEQSPFVEKRSMRFAMSQTFSLDNASQPAITEADTFDAPTSTIYATTQNLNYNQTFREGLKMSSYKLKDMDLSGNSIDGVQAFLNNVNKQVEIHMKQLKRDLEYSMINGVAQNGANDTTAFKMGGIYPAITTNKINGGGASLTKDMLAVQLANALANNGADYEDCVLLCSSKKVSEINELFGVQVRSERVGGLNISFLNLPIIGEVKICFSDLVPATVILVVDLAYCQGTAHTTAGQAQLAVIEQPTLGQGKVFELTGDLGIDFGHESKHGAIYNLAV